MSRLADEIILSKVAADAIDRSSAYTLVHLIAKDLPDDAGLDDIERGVAQAREALFPLFWTQRPSDWRAGR